MGLLDGGLQAVFGAAFGELYLDGLLHRATRVKATDGKVSETFSAEPINVQRDSCNESMRQAAGYTDQDARLIVLQYGIAPEPTTDDQITAGGIRWAIASVQSDPANSHWIIRGTPA